MQRLKLLLLQKPLQHKSLLLFDHKKVIVAKKELCGMDADHGGSSGSVAVDIIPPAVDECKHKIKYNMKKTAAFAAVLVSGITYRSW